MLPPGGRTARASAGRNVFVNLRIDPFARVAAGATKIIRIGSPADFGEIDSFEHLVDHVAEHRPAAADRRRRPGRRLHLPRGATARRNSAVRRSTRDGAGPCSKRPRDDASLAKIGIERQKERHRRCGRGEGGGARGEASAFSRPSPLASSPSTSGGVTISTIIGPSLMSGDAKSSAGRRMVPSGPRNWLARLGFLMRGK